MADYLDFPDYMFRMPNWAKTAVSLFLIGLAAKVALRPLKLLVFGVFCAAAIYLLSNFL